jgi:hypothetical protein
MRPWGIRRTRKFHHPGGFSGGPGYARLGGAGSLPADGDRLDGTGCRDEDSSTGLQATGQGY